jgi:DNA-binding CsgD family transcriptional regulator
MNDFLKNIELTEFDEQTGFASAIVVPIHMAFGQIGMAIFTGLASGKDDLSPKLTWVADRLGPTLARFVSSYATINADDRYMPVNTVLSRREIECLNWVAQGKTDYEISIILGCSHAGVRYHLARVGVKFGSANRTQSVFRACQLGYLSSPTKGK